jgi:cytochrome c-type biogenesis protein CcmF
MIPELGHLALILALVIAVIQASFPLLGSLSGNRAWMEMARPLAYGQFALIAIAFAALIQAFLTSDFSVRYVAENSNSLLPDIYKVSAVWGGHEGSLLLWALMMAAWGLAVAAFSGNLPQRVIARVISVQGMIAVGFLLFMLLTSSPFERLFPVPGEGRDLNPLLQDPGLAIHPPMLYMGYVGFSPSPHSSVASSTPPGPAGHAPGPRSPGSSSPSASRSAPGGPTTSSAGAAGGSGIRSRTPL